MERLDIDPYVRWFVGLGVDDPVLDHSTFSKNRDQLLEGDVAARFLSTPLARPPVKRLMSSEHFSVDGTLIEALGTTKSFKPWDGGRGWASDFFNSLLAVAETRGRNLIHADDRATMLVNGAPDGVLRFVKISICAQRESVAGWSRAWACQRVREPFEAYAGWYPRRLRL